MRLESICKIIEKRFSEQDYNEVCLIYKKYFNDYFDKNYIKKLNYDSKNALIQTFFASYMNNTIYDILKNTNTNLLLQDRDLSEIFMIILFEYDSSNFLKNIKNIKYESELINFLKLTYSIDRFSKNKEVLIELKLLFLKIIENENTNLIFMKNYLVDFLEDFKVSSIKSEESLRKKSLQNFIEFSSNVSNANKIGFLINNIYEIPKILVKNHNYSSTVFICQSLENQVEFKKSNIEFVVLPSSIIEKCNTILSRELSTLVDLRSNYNDRVLMLLDLVPEYIFCDIYGIRVNNDNYSQVLSLNIDNSIMYPNILGDFLPNIVNSKIDTKFTANFDKINIGIPIHSNKIYHSFLEELKNIKNDSYNYYLLVHNTPEDSYINNSIQTFLKEEEIENIKIITYISNTHLENILKYIDIIITLENSNTLNTNLLPFFLQGKIIYSLNNVFINYHTQNLSNKELEVKLQYYHNNREILEKEKNTYWNNIQIDLSLKDYTFFQFLANPELSEKQIYQYNVFNKFKGNFAKSEGKNYINMYTNDSKDTIIFLEKKIMFNNVSFKVSLKKWNTIYVYNNKLFINHIFLGDVPSYSKIESSFQILFENKPLYTFIFKTDAKDFDYTKLVYQNINYDNKKAVFLTEEEIDEIDENITFINIHNPGKINIQSDKFIIINYKYWIHPLFVHKIEELLFQKLETNISVTTNISYDGKELNYSPNKDYIHILEDLDLEGYIKNKSLQIKIKPYNRNNLFILFSKKGLIPFETYKSIELDKLLNYDYELKTIETIITDISKIPLDLCIVLYFTYDTERDLEILQQTLKYYNLWRFRTQIIIIEEGLESKVDIDEMYDYEYIFIETKDRSLGKSYNSAMYKCNKTNILFTKFYNLVTEPVMENVFKFFVESKLESYHFFNKIIYYQEDNLEKHTNYLLNSYNSEDYFSHKTVSNMNMFNLSSESLLITNHALHKISGWSGLTCNDKLHYYLMDYKITKGLTRYFIGNEKILSFKPSKDKVSLVSEDINILHQIALLEKNHNITLNSLMNLNNIEVSKIDIKSRVHHFIIYNTEEYEYKLGNHTLFIVRGEILLDATSIKEYTESFLLSIYQSLEGIKIYFNHTLNTILESGKLEFTYTSLETESFNTEIEYIPNQTLLNRQIQKPELVVKDYSMGQFWEFIMPSNLIINNDETENEFYQITSPLKGVETHNVGIVSILFNNNNMNLKDYKYHHLVIDSKDNPSQRPPLCKFIYIPNYYLNLYSLWNNFSEIKIEKTKAVAFLENRNLEEGGEKYLEVIRNEFEVTTINNTYFENMVSILSDYNFVVIIEDYLAMGHVSDRIMAALKAHTIPLYLGSPDIESHIKPEYFINLRNIETDNLVSTMNSLLENSNTEVETNNKLVSTNYLLDNTVLREQLEYYINNYQSPKKDKPSKVNKTSEKEFKTSEKEFKTSEEIKTDNLENEELQSEENNQEVKVV